MTNLQSVDLHQSQYFELEWALFPLVEFVVLSHQLVERVVLDQLQSLLATMVVEFYRLVNAVFEHGEVAVECLWIHQLVEWTNGVPHILLGELPVQIGYLPLLSSQLILPTDQCLLQMFQIILSALQSQLLLLIIQPNIGLEYLELSLLIVEPTVFPLGLGSDLPNGHCLKPQSLNLGNQLLLPSIQLILLCEEALLKAL